MCLNVPLFPPAYPSGPVPARIVEWRFLGETSICEFGVGIVGIGTRIGGAIRHVHYYLEIDNAVRRTT